LSVVAIDRSAAALTVVVSVSELLALLGSAVVAETVAVSLRSTAVQGRHDDRDVGCRTRRSTTRVQVTTPEGCPQVHRIPWR
jgi:hypothetical protein